MDQVGIHGLLQLFLVELSFVTRFHFDVLLTLSLPCCPAFFSSLSAISIFAFVVAHMAS